MDLFIENFVFNIMIKSINNIIIDKLEYKWYQYIKDNILQNLSETIKKYDINNIKEICNSINNSKKINVFVERLTSQAFIKSFIVNDINYKIYCGSNMADNSFEIDNCYIHVDSKGVETKNKKLLPLTKKEEKELMEKYGNDYKVKIDLLKNENYTLDIKTNKLKKIQYCDDYEMFNDDKDYNLHFKESQSNLCGFYGRFNNKPIEFKGKLPLETNNKPHLCFIIKHVYNKDNGIKKIVLYSIPHHNNQKIYYIDIQKELNKIRINKAKDEFRFNMNDENNIPYKFISNNCNRYCALDI